jgi:hypothetical protein
VDIYGNICLDILQVKLNLLVFSMLLLKFCCLNVLLFN